MAGDFFVVEMTGQSAIVDKWMQSANVKIHAVN